MKPDPRAIEAASRKVGNVPRSAFAAFRYKPYTVIWIASVVSNIGTWMYSAASGWLMTSLNPDQMMVSLVQAASTLPMFLLALPAGALTDIYNKRRFLIAGESSITLVSLLFALLVSLNRVNTGTLLLFAFLLATGSALVSTCWQWRGSDWC